MAKRKAISLMSGGLDSTLATKIILDQGIEVIGLFLESPFGCKEEVQDVAKHLGIKLRVVDKGMAFIELIRNPKYGYGKNMNPCIDCRIYMFDIAHMIMEKEEADFIITGEVLGQRPMSQRRDAMDIIDRDSKTKGLVLRPLSALHNPPTLAEIEGWVDREQLLGIQGRGRSEQLKWAESLQLKSYMPPGGGCLLTDVNFSTRLRQFLETHPEPTMTEVRLLRYGRHFDLSDGSHLVIGRDAEENEHLQEVSKDDVSENKMTLLRPYFSGPMAVLVSQKKPETTILDEAAALIAKYSKKSLVDAQMIEVKRGEISEHITVEFPPATQTEALPVLN